MEKDKATRMETGYYFETKILPEYILEEEKYTSGFGIRIPWKQGRCCKLFKNSLDTACQNACTCEGPPLSKTCLSKTYT